MCAGVRVLVFSGISDAEARLPPMYVGTINRGTMQTDRMLGKERIPNRAS